ncbi:MAG: EamA family transporter, partial [Halobacteriaceae archaeon]
KRYADGAVSVTGVHRVGASINSAGISTRPLFATLLAAAWLGETVTAVTIVGIVILVSGLVVLTTSKGGDISGWDPIHLVYPLAAAAAFGFGNVLRRLGLQGANVTLLEAVAINEFAALVVLASYAVWQDREDVMQAPRSTYAYFAGSGTITAVALLSLFAALQIGRVVVVDPLAATAPLFTTVFAAVFLRDLEQVTRGVVAGAVLVVAGVALIVGGSELLGAL